MSYIIAKGSIFLAENIAWNIKKIKIAEVTETCYLLQDCMNGKMIWIRKEQIGFDIEEKDTYDFYIIEELKSTLPF